VWLTSGSGLCDSILLNHVAVSVLGDWATSPPFLLAPGPSPALQKALPAPALLRSWLDWHPLCPRGWPLESQSLGYMAIWAPLQGLLCHFLVTSKSQRLLGGAGPASLGTQ
jgi:hypothetical protein